MELEASSTASGEERGGTYPTRHSQRVKDIERTLYQLEQRARDLYVVTYAVWSSINYLILFDITHADYEKFSKRVRPSSVP